MGLDVVEMVMAVEEAFAIEIKDEEGSALVTVGDLQRLVVSKLRQGRERGLSTARVFWILRRGLMEVAGVERRQVQPVTSLETLLPRKGRATAWARLEATTGLKLPQLQHPGSLMTTLVLAGAALGLLTGWGVGTTSGGGQAGWAAAGAIGGLGLSRRSRYAVEWPREVENVWALTRRTMERNRAQMGGTNRAWTEGEVLAELRGIIAMQAGIDLEAVVPEARIVEDLGIS